MGFEGDGGGKINGYLYVFREAEFYGKRSRGKRTSPISKDRTRFPPPPPIIFINGRIGQNIRIFLDIPNPRPPPPAPRPAPRRPRLSWAGLILG